MNCSNIKAIFIVNGKYLKEAKKMAIISADMLCSVANLKDEKYKIAENFPSILWGTLTIYYN